MLFVFYEVASEEKKDDDVANRNSEYFTPRQLDCDDFLNTLTYILQASEHILKKECMHEF